MQSEHRELGIDPKTADKKAQKYLSSDSTYYMGWLYEGAFLFDRAADFVGYGKCIYPFLRAKLLLEKEYAEDLFTRTRKYEKYYQIFPYQDDYQYISYCLSQSYATISRPDSSYWIAEEYKRINFQKDVNRYHGPYISQAWIVYRNRYRLDMNFAFLQSELDSNVNRAEQLMDSSKWRNENNAEINNQALSFVDNNLDLQSYYHFQSILFSYKKQFEDAEESYDKLENLGYFSFNNYALLKMAEGQFAQSNMYFEYERKGFPEQKFLEEWIYYLSILNTYNGENKRSIRDLKSWIDKVGSTPGYGWYQIALARALAYNGNLKEAEDALTKARFFTEYHIGTTLGQESYEQAISFLDLFIQELKLHQIKFENKRWYLSLSYLWKYTKVKWNIWIRKWVLQNELANFSDREKLVYDLFSGESVSGWQELYLPIQDFSPRYFLRYYQSLIASENTPAELLPFYKFAKMGILMEQGQDKKAQTLAEELRRESLLADPYYRLLAYELECKYSELGLENERKSQQNKYRMYPTMLPFSSERMHFNVEYYGEKSDHVERIKDRLGRTNIGFNTEKNPEDPTAIITFMKSQGRNFASVSLDFEGERLLEAQKFSLESEEDALKIAYALFQIYKIKPDENEY